MEEIKNGPSEKTDIPTEMAPIPIPDSDPFFVAKKQRYMDELWQRALNLLYKERVFTQYQTRARYDQIPKYYATATKENIDAFHQSFLRRLELALAYRDRRPEDRFIPVPQTYFDPIFKDGFVGTKPWYEKRMVIERRAKNTRIYNESMATYWVRFKSGEYDPIQLYREQEKLVIDLKQDDLLKRFYKEVGPRE